VGPARSRRFSNNGWVTSPHRTRLFLLWMRARFAYTNGKIALFEARTDGSEVRNNLVTAFGIFLDSPAWSARMISGLRLSASPRVSATTGNIGKCPKDRQPTSYCSPELEVCAAERGLPTEGTFVYSLGEGRVRKDSGPSGKKKKKGWLRRC